MQSNLFKDSRYTNNRPKDNESFFKRTIGVFSGALTAFTSKLQIHSFPFEYVYCILINR